MSISLACPLARSPACLPMLRISPGPFYCSRLHAAQTAEAPPVSLLDGVKGPMNIAEATPTPPTPPTPAGQRLHWSRTRDYNQYLIRQRQAVCRMKAALQATLGCESEPPAVINAAGGGSGGRNMPPQPGGIGAFTARAHCTL